MKNILVPTDFSVKSLNALTLAKRIASKSNGTVHILHVVQPIHSHYSITGEAVKDEMADLFTIRLIAHVEKEIIKLKKDDAEESYKITSEIRLGKPFEEIKAMADGVNADLIIIGDKGMSDSEDFFLGSLTDKVIRSLSIPVLTVKDVIEDEDFYNIVYATDLAEDQAPIMDLVLKFQDLFESKVHVVTINTPKNFTNDLDSLVELQKLATKYELKDFTLCNYGHEDEEYGIVQYAEEKGANLIIMGVHEKSGFRRLISGGSLASEVSNHTFRPVLTYKLQKEEK